jgi:hypothetical protein
MDAASKTLDSNRQQESIKQAEWLCLPCYEGLLVIPQSEYKITHLPQQKEVGIISFLGDKHDILNEELDGKAEFLPGSPLDKIFLDEPPLPIRLSSGEVKELVSNGNKSRSTTVVAATFYGPDTQEKKSNEDFALSALIKDAKQGEWAFAAVADGVGTKTFWAARTSRIACLAAFKVIRQFILSSPDTADTTLERLREDLVEALRVHLHRDKQKLLSYKHIVPSNFSPESYHHFLDRDELWYNSTLLVTVLGPDYGFIIRAGDGGIELLKTIKNRDQEGPETIDRKTVLISTDDVSIGTFVSLGVSTKDFALARITYDENLSKIDVYLSSDGVDRTLQKNAENLCYEKLELENHQRAREQLKMLSNLPDRDNDNFSIALVSRYFGATGEAHRRPGVIRKHSGSITEPLRPPDKELPARANQKDSAQNPRKHFPSLWAPVTNLEKHSGIQETILRFPFIAGLLTGMILGLVAGSVLMKLYGNSSITNRSPVNNNGSQSAQPAEHEKTGIALPVIKVNEKVQNWVKSGSNIPQEISSILDEWLSHLKSHSTNTFSIVAYADRSSLKDSKECYTNASISKKRAEAVFRELSQRAKREGIDLDLVAAQRVCEAPAGVNITDKEARQIVLIEGKVEDCICGKE